MNEEGQNFDRLRQALALKRHETPPPRYFTELPGKILSRLGELEKFEDASLWTRLGRLLGERPIFATGAGVAAGCALLLGIGLIVLQDTAPTGTASMPTLPAHNMAFTDAPRGVTDSLSLAPSNSNAGKDLFNSFQPTATPASAILPSRAD
jgi:hypothetical protein